MTIVDNIRKTKFWQQLLAEFVGSFFFLFISVGVIMSTDVNNPLDGDFETIYADRQLTIALAFGTSILVLGYTFGHVSGTHLNPAVTLPLVLYGRLEWYRGIGYVIAQMLGAICGVALLKSTVPSAWHTSFGLNVLHPEVTVWQGVMLEIVGTAALTMVIFGTVVDDHFNQPRGRAALVAIIPISSTVFLAHILLIPLTGCGINPSRSFASAVVSGNFDNHWIYWVGPLAGGINKI